MSKFHRTDWDLLPERAFLPRQGRAGPMTLEGGGGSSAPAPDPRLVDAQIRSMGMQEDLLQKVQANSDALMPLQKEQLQFGLDSSREAYNQSQQDRQWMLTRRAMLSGLQDKMSSEAANFYTEAKREELAGKAIGDVNQAFGAARGQTARHLASMGVLPGSGASLAADKQLLVQQALAQTTGANAARTQAREEGRAMTDRAHNALAGYPAMSTATTDAGARYGSNGVNVVNASGAGQNAGYTTAAQIAGQLGTNSTGMFGAQATREANARNGNNFGDTAGGIGSLVGAGLKLWTEYKKP